MTVNASSFIPSAKTHQHRGSFDLRPSYSRYTTRAKTTHHLIGSKLFQKKMFKKGGLIEKANETIQKKKKKKKDTHRWHWRDWLAWRGSWYSADNFVLVVKVLMLKSLLAEKKVTQAPRVSNDALILRLLKKDPWKSLQRWLALSLLLVLPRGDYEGSGWILGQWQWTSQFWKVPAEAVFATWSIDRRSCRSYDPCQVGVPLVVVSCIYTFVIGDDVAEVAKGTWSHNWHPW